jgi:4,5-DOPA dioxygenase extradiol
MTGEIPSIFVSHGAPTLAIDRVPAAEFLRALGAAIGRPTAVLTVSAHWQARRAAASVAANPQTIYDFSGFAPELYRISYDAPGAPEVARRAVELLGIGGVDSELSNDRGLDHGAWVPLSLMYPEADVPVAQISLEAGLGPAEHMRVGAALVPLGREGVLVLGSGGAVHNLGRISWNGGDPPEWAKRFDAWLRDAVERGAYDELARYRELAPDAALSHPTEEHLLPLLVAAGAGGASGPGASLHESWTYGSLSMASYAFGAGAAEFAAHVRGLIRSAP